MIHPSYNELYDVINQDAKDEPVVASRYSVCIATAKRAKQLIAGAEPTVEIKCDKPLSIAVDEIYRGNVKVLGDEETDYKDSEDDYYFEDAQN